MAQGAAVRAGQREACLLAVEAAVAASAPLLLECHAAPPAKAKPDKETKEVKDGKDDKDGGTEESEEKPPMDDACADMLRILVKAAPPAATLVLRCGSLTTSPKLPKLLQVWPKVRTKVAILPCLAASTRAQGLIGVIVAVPCLSSSWRCPARSPTPKRPRSSSTPPSTSRWTDSS